MGMATATHWGTKSPRTARTSADLAQAAKLLALAVPCWLLPIDSLGTLSRLIEIARHARTRSDRHGPAEAALAKVLGTHVPAYALRDILAQWAAQGREAKMQLLALHRPGHRWRPSIRWHGLEHLTTALERRSGAILWQSDFVFQSLIAKMAFHRANVPFSHLSRPEHGFSESPFGIRFFNPLCTRIEDRFIAERVRIVGNDGHAALGVLRSHLAANRIVSILVWNKARRTVDANFLAGKIRVATGPAYLSRISHAPLLPVFTTRADDGVYEVTIDRPLDVESRSDPLYADTVQSYAKALEPHALAHPDQWNGWWGGLVLPSADTGRQ
jgi:lauroyl/myristoyl acyltransferase